MPATIFYTLALEGESPEEARQRLDMPARHTLLIDCASRPLEARPGRVEALRALHDGARVVVWSLRDLFATISEAAEILSPEGETRGQLMLSWAGGEVIGLGPRGLVSHAATLVLHQLAEMEAQARALPVSGARGGVPPYGWRWSNGRLVTRRGEQLVIAEMARLRGEGASWSEVAEELNKGKRQTRRGRAWSLSTARRAFKASRKAAADQAEPSR